MKRTQLLFPLMFLVALGASAFSFHAKSAKSDQSIGYYYDPNWNTCDAIQLDDGKCMSDNLGYTCMEFIPGIGYQYVFQGVFGNTCYQPFYSYVP
jgi:hypothetical protein